MNAGFKVQITDIWVSIMEDKVVRHEKMDKYMEQRFEAMNEGTKTYLETETCVPGLNKTEMIIAVKDNTLLQTIKEGPRIFPDLDKTRRECSER